MNIKNLIRESLWEAIEFSYKAEDYKSAILNAVVHLTELIRSKSGLGGDGVKLVGGAFGADHPKIRVTPCRTDNEKSIQDGMRLALMGVYRLIRNPRSHGRKKDSVEDFLAIILWINYLENKIEESPSEFSVEEFLEQLLDEDFYPNERYAKELVKKIPRQLLLDTVIAIIDVHCDIGGDVLEVVLPVLLSELNPKESEQISAVFSTLLAKTKDADDCVFLLQLFPEQIIKKIETQPKLRLENKLAKSIKKGAESEENIVNAEGFLGIFFPELAPFIILKEEFIQVIWEKFISSEADEKRYFYLNLLEALPVISPKADPDFIDVIKSELGLRDEIAFQGVQELMKTKHTGWKRSLSRAFKECSLFFEKAESEGEEVPF